MKKYSSVPKWEPIFGYSRAVKVDNRVYISGTTATGADGEIVGKDDPYLQTKQTLQNVQKALIAFGLTYEDVYRTRRSGRPV